MSTKRIIKRKVRKVKLRKRKHKVQKGGVLVKEHKLLGVGSFGWIVTPAVPCKGTKISYDKISKFAKKEDVTDDIKIGKKLSKIDKSGKYFLYVKESCKISIKKVDDILNTDFTELDEDMKAAGEGPLIFYNLIMDKGDITLQKYFGKYRVGDIVAVKILIKLLKCIEKLIKNGFIHTDLHSENIILKKTGKNKFEVVIIDFGDIATDTEWKKYAKKNNLETKKDYYIHGEKNMIFNIVSNIKRGSSNKIYKLLDKMRGKTIKECLNIIKEAGYDLSMDLSIPKRDTKPKPPPKKSFFQKIFG